MSKVCYGCFKSVNDEYSACPYCGFDFHSYNISDRALHPGTVLNGKYIVGKTLGEGGFGITYLAWDRYMEIKIAIKEYYPSNIALRDTSMYGGNTLHVSSGSQNGDFESGLKRYVKEAAILSKFFNLPGIVSVKDFFYENGTAYIVMEYIEGISLREYLKGKGGKVSVNEALNIIEPIIKSLTVVHKNKLLHRDISPDNIMISREGKVKLIDFGAARYFVDDSDRSLTVVLKHGYAPIEQYSRKGEQGEWTDVYALCAVLYRMISGVVPDEAVERVHHDTLVPLRKIKKEIPKHIAAAIEKGLCIQAEDRLQDMQELYEELYLTKEELKRKKAEATTSTAIKILITAIIAIVIGIEVIVISSVKKDKNSDMDDIVDLVTQIEKEVVEDEESSIKEVIIEDTESQTKPQISSQTVQESLTEEEHRQNIQNLEILKTHEEVEQQKRQEDDKKLQHAIVVARDGFLNGVSESYTLGMILDSYGEVAGNWYSSVNANGNFDVYYQGTKNGEAFTILFEVYAGDTFKLIGVAVNNEPVENYASYFQQILNEIGL